MEELLLAVLKNVAIPEILVAIRAHRNATGADPTNEQILAALDVKGMAVRSQGQAFLDATAPK